MNDPIKYKTSSPGGDLISYLPGIRQMYRETGRKAIIYQRVGMPGDNHAFVNRRGNSVCMNRDGFNHMKPLLLMQEYIEDFVVYVGQSIDIDLDVIRLEIFTNQPKGSIHRYGFYAYPQMACDLTEKWLDVPPNENYSDAILINHTSRYRNHLISYFFLKEYQEKISFIGLESEYFSFKEQWNLEIPHLKVSNFIELAALIGGCKFFMGNASMCFHLAEAQKTPRMLELFEPAPNVIPYGKNGYDYYHQGSAEYYFKKLMNEENKKL